MDNNNVALKISCVRLCDLKKNLCIIDRIFRKCSYKFWVNKYLSELKYIKQKLINSNCPNSIIDSQIKIFLPKIHNASNNHTKTKPALTSVTYEFRWAIQDCVTCQESMSYDGHTTTSLSERLTCYISKQSAINRHLVFDESTGDYDGTTRKTHFDCSEFVGHSAYQILTSWRFMTLKSNLFSIAYCMNSESVTEAFKNSVQWSSTCITCGGKG